MHYLPSLFLFFSATLTHHAHAMEPNKMIAQCVAHLDSVHHPGRRASVYKLGDSVRERPELRTATHAVVLMKQTTSHNYLLLLKTLTLARTRDLRDAALSLPPQELLLLELSEEEHEAFLAESSEVGTFGLAPPPRPEAVAAQGPVLFPGSLLEIDEDPYVVLQELSHTTFNAHECRKRKSRYLMACLDEVPKAGAVGTKIHHLELEADGRMKLDDGPIDRIRQIGQAEVILHALLNSVGGQQLRAELLHVIDDSNKRPESLNIELRDFVLRP